MSGMAEEDLEWRKLPEWQEVIDALAAKTAADERYERAVDAIQKARPYRFQTRLAEVLGVHRDTLRRRATERGL